VRVSLYVRVRGYVSTAATSLRPFFVPFQHSLLPSLTIWISSLRCLENNSGNDMLIQLDAWLMLIMLATLEALKKS
jgi:hypothetical protein